MLEAVSEHLVILGCMFKLKSGAVKTGVSGGLLSEQSVRRPCSFLWGNPCHYLQASLLRQSLFPKKRVLQAPALGNGGGGEEGIGLLVSVLRSWTG